MSKILKSPAWQLHNRIISAWGLQEASGNRADNAPVNSLKATVNTLTDTNTVTGNPGPGSGNYKPALASQFTAANSERLVVADNASVSTGDIDFAFTAWCYFDSLGTVRPIINKRPAGVDQLNSEYWLNYNSGTATFRWQVTDTTTTSGIVDATTFGAPTTATWYFLYCYHDSVNNLIGISVNAGTVDTLSWTSGVRDSAAVFNIGGQPSGAFQNGRVAAVTMHKRVLTATEVTYLYNGGSGRLWPFT